MDMQFFVGLGIGFVLGIFGVFTWAMLTAGKDEVEG